MLALLALAGRASAHERDFTLSRDWHLPYAGEHEIELRFNFLDFGYGKLLPAFNLEYEHRVGGELESENPNRDFEAEEQAFEVKGILFCCTERGEDFTVNVNVGRVWEEHESEFEGETTFGCLRTLDFIPGWESPADHPIGIGLEFLQQLSKDKFSEIGPVVTSRASKNLHVLMTALYAIYHRDEHNDELRLVLEWEF